MAEKINTAQNYSKIVITMLKDEGWNVRSATNGEFIYTTPEGRTSTLCLHQYENDGYWRWHIDHHSVRTRGKSKMVAPCPPKEMSGNSELTVFEDELPMIAAWLAHWMIAADRGSAFPECPVQLECGSISPPGAYSIPVPQASASGDG